MMNYQPLKYTSSTYEYDISVNETVGDQSFNDIQPIEPNECL
jgi:hypothetical protein